MLAFPFTASHTILLLTASTMLLAYEFNRPGTIVPGMLGLLGILLAVASITREPNAAPILAALIAFLVMLLLNLRKPHILFSLLAAAAETDALVALAHNGPNRNALLLALPCAVVIAVGTSLLTGIAHRARANKAAAKGLD